MASCSSLVGTQLFAIRDQCPGVRVGEYTTPNPRSVRSGSIMEPLVAHVTLGGSNIAVKRIVNPLSPFGTSKRETSLVMKEQLPPVKLKALGLVPEASRNSGIT